MLVEDRGEERKAGKVIVDRRSWLYRRKLSALKGPWEL